MKCIRKLLAGVWLVACLPAWAEVDHIEVAKIRTELAANYFQRGQFEVALEELNHALGAAGSFAPAYGLRALIYTELRDYATANEAFLRALHYAGNDSDINHNYGWFLCMRMNKPAESIKYFTAALQNPLYASPARTQAVGAHCAVSAGKLELAQDWISRASRFNPNNTDLMLSQAEYALAGGDLISARRYLNRFNQASPQTSTSLWLGVRLEHKAGDMPARDKLARELKNAFTDSFEASLLAAGKFE
ncbi:type IV pilus biogenesis/stability protein PilW [Burkholderiaceae bacterium DAT-1]|nr:type IV pilus biogenesis/stability protein PilW [Burkholderiaceae bacterium DAT-1]